MLCLKAIVLWDAQKVILADDVAKEATIEEDMAGRKEYDKVEITAGETDAGKEGDIVMEPLLVANFAGETEPTWEERNEAWEKEPIVARSVAEEPKPIS